ncbi:MAG: hypothetical protein ACOYS2_03415 [Patescibacteria group bacterium]
MKKNKAKLILLLIGLIIFLPAFSWAADSTSTRYEYKLLEGLPGFYSANESPTFNAYISAIYKFGIWVVGIAALLMISIGAFMYLTSAGNNAAMGSAKNVITDAIIGLVLALLAWLLLYTINPELVSPKGIPETGSTSSSTTSSGTTTSGSSSSSTTDKKASQSNMTAQEVKSQLDAAGIEVNRTCIDKDASGCTKLSGVTQTAIDGAKDINSKVGDITINGATETVNHSSKTNHADGHTLDIKLQNSSDTAKMETYLKEQVSAGKVTQVCSNGFSHNCSSSEPTNVYHVQWAKS